MVFEGDLESRTQVMKALKDKGEMAKTSICKRCNNDVRYVNTAKCIECVKRESLQQRKRISKFDQTALFDPFALIYRGVEA